MEVHLCTGRRCRCHFRMLQGGHCSDFRSDILLRQKCYCGASLLEMPADFRGMLSDVIFSHTGR
jgi:hypothetical protein